MLEPVLEDEAEVMSEAALSRALETIRARIARAHAQRGELERIIARWQEEQRLMERLLALRTATAPTPPEPAAEDARPAEEPSAPRDGLAVGLNHPIIQAVVDELAQARRPLHISELMRLLRNRGLPIPGSGTQANLISYLRRDKRVARPSRGMYGLTAWGLVSMPSSGRRRRRRMRARAKEGGNQS